jgi:hypothetical protein
MIYENGDTWWNDVERRKLLICPPENSGKLTSTVI